MPVVNQTVHREEVLTVVADRSHMQTLTGNFLDAAYFTLDSSQHKYIRPGLIVAQETNTKKYVPYNASALYGVGSDTAVGVLDVFVDATLEDPTISPVYHGKLIEAHCYAWGGALGTVAAGVKSALVMVKWV